MKYIIDTNSLLALIRYYIQMDKDNILMDFFKNHLTSKQFIIIDKVLEESKYVSQGIILNYLSFLSDKSFMKHAELPFKTENIIAPSPSKFIRQVEHQFTNNIIKTSKKLTNEEYNSQIKLFLENADIKQILVSLNIFRTGELVTIVTEETEISNDNKLFKKIPSICKILNIPTITIAELLEKYFFINTSNLLQNL